MLMKYPVLFLSFTLLLMGFVHFMPHWFMEGVVVQYFAVRPGAYVIDLMAPGMHVAVLENRIVSSVANLNVLRGCEGTEMLILLYAAIFAALRTVKATVFGVFLGSLLVFVLNQMRIVVLFFVAAYGKDYFDLVHGFLAPLMILAFSGMFFFVWLERVSEPFFFKN